MGLLLGSDVLYPEVGRVLAYQNAEMILLQGACPKAASYHKLQHAGVLARMQDNQLYAAASFVVGANPLRKGADPYMGRSAILAPQELTPKYNGVLVEMGSAQSEGVVTAEWDYTALKRLWETSETSIRTPLAPEDADRAGRALHATEGAAAVACCGNAARAAHSRDCRDYAGKWPCPGCAALCAGSR